MDICKLNFIDSSVWDRVILLIANNVTGVVSLPPYNIFEDGNILFSGYHDVVHCVFSRFSTCVLSKNSVF